MNPRPTTKEIGPFSSAAQRRLLNFFFYATLVGTALALFLMLLYYAVAFSAKHLGSREFDWLLGIFSDFVEIMSASLNDSPHLLGGSSYPPLAVLILYPFARILSGVFARYGNAFSVEELTARVILHPEFWVALILFFLLTTAAILFVVIRGYGFDPPSALRVGGTILFSSPFVYAIMRGNTVDFSLLFLLLFLLFLKDSRPFVREMSYVCLALAGALKIYPLFFGVYLLHEKRIGAALRVALYFGLLFLLPFFLFKAGDEGIPSFLENLGGFMFSDERLLSLRNLSLSSLLYKLFSLFSATGGALFSPLHTILIVLFFLSATVTATVTTSSLSRGMIAAGTVILLPSISYFYVLVFTLIPFLEFVRRYDELSLRKKRLYTSAFFLLYCTPLVIPQCFIPHAILILLLLLSEEISVWRREILPTFRKRLNWRHFYVR